jgi:hypothetical protein
MDTCMSWPIASGCCFVFGRCRVEISNQRPAIENEAFVGVTVPPDKCRNDV